MEIREKLKKYRELKDVESKAKKEAEILRGEIFKYLDENKVENTQEGGYYCKRTTADYSKLDTEKASAFITKNNLWNEAGIMIPDEDKLIALVEQEIISKEDFRSLVKPDYRASLKVGEVKADD